MSETLIDARWIGAAFAEDPELELPARPRLPPEILVIPFGTEALILAGTREKQLLKGRSARTLVPRVLPLLDGEHTLEEIVVRFPDQPAHAIRDIVALLYHRGVLEDGRADAPPPQLRDADAFMGRYNDITRINRNRGDALRRLSEATVVVGGEPAMAATLASSLTASGVGNVSVLDRGMFDASCDLVVVVSTPEHDTALLDTAHRANQFSLATWIGRDAVLLGPLNIPGQSGCYTCLRRRGLPKGEPRNAVMNFWIGMTALRAIHLVSRIANPPPFESYQLVTLHDDGAVTRLLPMPRTPGCETCGVIGPPIDDESPAYQAWSLYNATSRPPANLLSSKDYEIHYNPKNFELAQQEAPACAGAKVIALPAPKAFDGPAWRDVPPARVVDLSDLATLLARAAGFQIVAGSVRRRVAPTGGDLGSVELGVIVSDIRGIDPGVYRYHAPRHVLERMPGAPAEKVRRALDVAEGLPAAVIAGLGGLAKVYQKYDTFAYRIVHFDAGVAAAYLHRLATALGLAVCELSEFRDDALAELFLLDFDHSVQIPTFAIGIGGQPETRVVETAPLQQVIDAATSSRRAAMRLSLAAARADAFPPPTSFDQIILDRRSVRSYTREAIPAAVLRELCVLGAGAASRRIACGIPESTAVQLVLAVADGGSHLEGGVYRVCPERTEMFVPARRGLTRDDLAACLLQSAHAAAPAVLFVLGDLGAALADRGARGLREAMVQAGAAVGEIWLAATAHGLGACASGGVIEPGLRALIGADGYRSAPLLAIALGYPRVEWRP